MNNAVSYTKGFLFYCLKIVGGRRLALVLALSLLAGQGFGQLEEVMRAERLLAEGDSLLGEWNYKEAEPKLVAAKDIFYRNGEYECALEALLGIYQVFDMTSRNVGERQVVEEIFSICSDYISPKSYYWGMAYHIKGQELLGLGEVDSAIYYQKKALDVIDTCPKPIKKFSCYLELAECYELIGNLEAMSKALNEADRVLGNFRSAHHRKKLVLMNFFSGMSLKYGDFDKALEYRFVAEEIWSGISPKKWVDTMNLAVIYGGIGEIYSHMGTYEGMIEYSKKQVALLRSLEFLPMDYLAPSISNLGYFLAAAAKNKEALKYCLEARSYFLNPRSKREASNNFINLTHLVNIYLSTDELDLDQAIYYCLEALEVAEKWDLDAERALSFYGASLILQEQYEEALKPLRRAVSVKDDENLIFAASSYLELSNLFFYRGEMDSALYYIQKSLMFCVEGFEGGEISKNPNPDEYNFYVGTIEALEAKASFLNEMAVSDSFTEGYLKLANETFLVGEQFIQKKLEKDKDGISHSHSFYADDTYRGAVETGSGLFHRTSDPDYFFQAFASSEKMKDLSLLQSRLASEARGYGGLPSALLEEERELRRSLAFYEGKILEEENWGSEKDTLKLATWENKVFDLKRELEAWEIGIEEDFPTYLSGKNKESVTTPFEVQKRILETDEVLIEYVVGEYELFTFLITTDTFQAFRDSLPNDLDQQIADFNRCLSDYSFIHDSAAACYAQYTRSAQQLYEFLLGPALSAPHDFTKLTIVPDGALHQIPFEALLTAPPSDDKLNYTNLPYLLRDYRVRYCFSAALLKELQERPGNQGSEGCLALAPSYPKAQPSVTRGELAQLRGADGELEGAQLEVQALSELGLPGQFLIGESATEGSFKAVAPKYKLLHLALHGQADGDLPEASNIRFTATPLDTCEDNVLHAYELQALPLVADLVVLSACESGVGKYYEGEGVMSLGRFFMASGASSVVMTLWQVEDQASSQLMRSFYQGLQEGEPSAEALHQAKLDFLDQADSRTAHPFYWAGYTANGASKPLDLSNGGGNWWWIILGAVGVGLMGWRRMQRKAA